MRPPQWTTACPDWQERIVAGDSLVPFDPLFPDEAAAALAVFKSLRAVDVAGSPTLGEICDDFVFEFVAAIFGAYDADNARRLITDFLLLISKKNGKSMIAAGIMLTALIRNWRRDAELLILAPSMEVAMNSFGPAAAMVAADPELSKIIDVVTHQRLLRHLGTGAVLKVVAADSGTISGKKAGFVLVEEVWQFGKKAGADAMLREGLGGMSARPEGFVIYITTHSDEPPAGVWKDKLEYFRDVRDGVIEDPRAFGMLYEFPPAMIEAEAYLEVDNFYITNPHLGRSVTTDWLARELQKEQRSEGGEGLQVFLAKHLNVEIGTRLHRNRWRGADYWERSADPSLTLSSLLSRCEVAVVGVDGGGLDDLFAATVMGRERETGVWLCWSKAWVQEDVLTLRPVIAEQLRDFAADGDLVLCRDAVEDIDGIVDLCLTVQASGLMPDQDAIGVDAAGIGSLRQALHRAGFADEKILGVRQGWQLSATVVTAERALKNGRLVHARQGLTDFAVSNAKAEVKGSNILITKEVSGRAKIDPVISILNAARLMEMDPVAARSRVSVYETRGILRV